MNTRFVTAKAAVVVVILCSLQMEAVGQWVWSPQIGQIINLRNLPRETPELQIEHIRSLMLEGEYRQAMGETNLFMDYYSDSEYADENQFLRGEILYRWGRHHRAAQEFQQVVANYPASDLHEEVIERQYDIGDALYEEGLERLDRTFTWFRTQPLRQAIEVYNMVIDNQPFTAAAAEAQYKVGRCHQALDEYVEAAYEYRRLVEDYSGTEWVPEASYGLVASYYASTLPPAYDQSPSRLTINAIEDFIQRYPNDERVDELEETRQEMREKIAQQRLKTAQFYEKRRDFDSAHIYYEILVEEFADTEAADSAREWLADHNDQHQPLAEQLGGF